MPMDMTIKAKVEEFVKKNKMFTSMDIANGIKRDGVWVRNREVRDWLRDAVSSEPLLLGAYTNTLIDICSGAAQATLYYPLYGNPDMYTGNDQVALTPDEVKTIAKQKALAPVATAPDINTVFSNANDEIATAIIRSIDRVKIPSNIVKLLGWSPGDTIDPAAIKTHKVLPGGLKVSQDYRVSIPRKCIHWGTSPVKVILKSDNTIVFDKA
jgi:hypothetical protein